MTIHKQGDMAACIGGHVLEIATLIIREEDIKGAATLSDNEALQTYQWGAF